ncbi:MAG: hypothetical protein WCL00_02770 [Bacteroidota bacterium]
MKKLGLIIVLSIFSLTAFPQLHLGIKSGYNWFRIPQSDQLHLPSQFTYPDPSIPVSIFLCQRKHLVNIGLEIQYLSRSYTAQEEWGGLSSHGYAHYKISSSWIHLLFEPQFTFGRRLKIFIFPGVYLGMPLYSSINGYTTEARMGQPQVTHYLAGSAIGNIQNVEYVFLAGAGVEYPVIKHLFLSLQYLFSRSVTWKQGKYSDNNFWYVENKVEIGVAWQFDGKKREEGGK